MKCLPVLILCLALTLTGCGAAPGAGGAYTNVPWWQQIIPYLFANLICAFIVFRKTKKRKESYLWAVVTFITGVIGLLVYFIVSALRNDD